MSYDEDVVETFEESDELTLLKERADLMGIKYHPSIGVDKLREKVNSVLVPKDDPVPVKETAAQVRMHGIKKCKPPIQGLDYKHGSKQKRMEG